MLGPLPQTFQVLSPRSAGTCAEALTHGIVSSGQKWRFEGRDSAGGGSGADDAQWRAAPPSELSGRAHADQNEPSLIRPGSSQSE